MRDLQGDVAIRSDVLHLEIVRSNIDVLRAFVVAAGICWSVLFVVIGLHYQLQLYADGSIFSYSVAVQDPWTFHWHNIPDRVFVYIFCYLPAEIYVALTEDAHGGIVVYGLLFFAAQLLGLAATYATDRSKGRIIFGYACFSTAWLCPLVFGFPTEMWMAHALFWPALAVCHYARSGIGGIAFVFAILLALFFTHDGALILAGAILGTLLLRGVWDAVLFRAVGTVLVLVPLWVLMKLAFPPDEYIAGVLRSAALHVFDLSILTGDLILLMLRTLASYGIAFLIFRRFMPAKAHLFAAAIVAAALAVYWLWFDHALHTENRYYLRTVILIAVPVLGALATASALHTDGRLNPAIPLLPRLASALSGGTAVHAAMGAIVLVMLVHIVETGKFVAAWTEYRSAVRVLAMGTASDPALGDPRFVSSDRIRSDLGPLSWPSTTHFLSVLLAPGFAPARLVVDPRASYFWLSCATARANEEADRAFPAESRRLVRVHACLHRQPGYLTQTRENRSVS